MKRVLLSIALPLAIVALAWQFAPAEAEVLDTAVVEVPAADDEAAVDVAFDVAVTTVDAAGDAASPATRRDGRVDYKRLLTRNPDLVKVLIDNIDEGGDGEFDELIQVALISMDGAAVPHLLKILEETEDSEKKQAAAGLLATAAIFPNYPIEDVVPPLLKLAKSENEDSREIGIAVLCQVFHFQGMSEAQRGALRLEVQAGGF
ncbi:MAG: hypothetical protein H8E37_11000 [Planctomycetes bacterium]|nr:hypothetical protein [Planctomycetota bacterium]